MCGRLGWGSFDRSVLLVRIRIRFGVFKKRLVGSMCAPLRFCEEKGATREPEVKMNPAGTHAIHSYVFSRKAWFPFGWLAGGFGMPSGTSAWMAGPRTIAIRIEILYGCLCACTARAKKARRSPRATTRMVDVGVSGHTINPCALRWGRRGTGGRGRQEASGAAMGGAAVRGRRHGRRVGARARRRTAAAVARTPHTAMASVIDSAVLGSLRAIIREMRAPRLTSWRAPPRSPSMPPRTPWTARCS